MNETREQLADYAHVAWSGYMEYFLGKLETNPDGSKTIPAGYVTALLRQINTPYAELNDAEKDADRDEADRMLAIVQQSNGAKAA